MTRRDCLRCTGLLCLHSIRNFAGYRAAQAVSGGWSGEQIDRSRPDYQPPKHGATRSELAERIWLFFPEGVLGAILVLVAPFWSVRLAFTDHVGAAFVLVAGVSLAAYAFFQFMRRGHKYLAYFATVGALALVFVIYSATQ